MAQTSVAKAPARRPGMPVYSVDFFKTYVHKVGLPFSVDGKEAAWADNSTNPSGGGPLVPGQETSKIELPSPPNSVSLNDQETLLAVTSGHEISIYTYPELTLHTKSTEYLGEVEGAVFHPNGTLLAVSEKEIKDGRLTHFVSFWDIDSPSSVTPEEIRLNVTAEILDVARKALQEQAGWTPEYFQSSELHESLTKLLATSILQHDHRNRLSFHGTLHSANPFTSDGSLLFYVKERSKLVAWDVASNTERWSYSHEDAIMWAGLAPNGSILASVSWDHTVQLRDPASGEHLRTLTGPSGQNWAAAFSPDSSLLACGSGDQKIYIWKVDTGEIVHTLSGSPNWIRSISFSPDGKHLAAGSGSATFRIFDVVSGQEEQKWQVATDDRMALSFVEIRDVQYTRQGDKVGFKGSDSTTTVYDQERNVKWEIGRVQGKGPSGNFLFTSDGQRIVSADADNAVRIWDLKG